MKKVETDHITKIVVGKAFGTVKNGSIHALSFCHERDGSNSTQIYFSTLQQLNSTIQDLTEMRDEVERQLEIYHRDFSGTKK